jgi:hypothetical protein
MSELSWYLNRIRVMGIKEIITMRIYRFMRDSLIKPRLKVPKDLSLDIHRFGDEQREFYFAHFSHIEKDLIQEANLIMENRIKILGREIAYPKYIDWNKDFRTGKKWTLNRIDYHSFQAGDPRDTWELNRHQFLPVLGKAFYLTRDERYAQKAIAIINSWIEQNPPCRGINWASAFEIALRTLSWLWTLKYIASSKSLTQTTHKKICESLFRQADHIIRNLSLYSSANNHLIGELTALTLIGLHFNQERWEEKAEALLKEEIDLQLLPDGVGTEQSSFYHAHIMEYYVLIALIFKERGLVIAENILKSLERGAIFLQSLLGEDGYPPQIGDNDSGEVLKLSANYSNFKSILNLVAYISEEDGLLQEDISVDEKTFWLIGAENFQKLIKRRDSKRKNRAIRPVFPAGGYYILEKSFDRTQLKLIFDCGPLGMKPMAGHGHADALSFILYVNGLPVFIDPGTYTYFKSAFWRNYFRGTSAHNTIRIDGEDQSEFAGEFLASYHAQAKCIEWEEGRKVSGIHNGYVRYKNPVFHTRTISFEDNNSVVRISDIIETRGSHLLEQFFHINNRFIIIESGDKKFEIKTPQKEIRICMDQSLEVTVYYGDEVIPLGWQSKAFGHKDKSFSLVGRKRIASKTTLITEICF